MKEKAGRLSTFLVVHAVRALKGGMEIKVSSRVGRGAGRRGWRGVKVKLGA